MKGEINLKLCYIPPSRPLYERAIEETRCIKNKKATKLFTMAMTLLLCCNNLLAAESNPIKKLGYDGVSLVQLVLTFIAIFMALFEIGKAMLEGDPKRIPSIVAKYGIGVLCIYAIPTGYFYIRDAFAGWGY